MGTASWGAASEGAARPPDLLALLFSWQVTKLKLKQKQAEGIAEARSGQRGPVREIEDQGALLPPRQAWTWNTRALEPSSSDGPEHPAPQPVTAGQRVGIGHRSRGLRLAEHHHSESRLLAGAGQQAGHPHADAWSRLAVTPARPVLACTLLATPLPPHPWPSH